MANFRMEFQNMANFRMEFQKQNPGSNGAHPGRTGPNPGRTGPIRVVFRK